MKLFNFAVIKLTLFLTIGILLGHAQQVDLMLSLSLSILLLFLVGAAVFSLKNTFNPPAWFGVLVFVATTSVGMSSILIHNDKQYPSHYTNSIHTDTQNITVRIQEVLKPGSYQNKYIVDILAIESTSVSGKALLNIAKGSLTSQLAVDDIYVTRSKFTTIRPSLNPYQFNYKGYLMKKHIYHQLNLNQGELLQLSSKTHTVLGYAARIRTQIQNRLKQYNFSTDELGVINALLLGQRQELSNDIYERYAQAGAVHILAVSGLHVGIILLILNYLLKPIEVLRNGRYYKMIIIVSLLWCFALIAGLSASVTRAVSMFTVFAIALQLKRPTNAYNTLAISMFFILLFKPLFIFDVGFQLSYMAVLAIISIQPLLYRLVSIKYPLIDNLWRLSTVTIAAQFGILPISLYYFHQFPSLFFLSNLVIIPLLGFILGYGILSIVLAMLKILPMAMAEFYGTIISTMNAFVIWISNQETFLFEDISFGKYHVILSYASIIAGYFLIKHKTFKTTIVFLITIIIIQSFLFWNTNDYSTNKFIIFHKSRYSLIGQQQHAVLQVYHDIPDSIFISDNVITNYKVGAQIKKINYDTIQSVYQLGSKFLLIVDSSTVYQQLSFQPNFVMLRQSPKINLTRLINTLQPELIIFDGSNYNSYQEQWEATCQTKKLPFHRTSKKGAYIFNY